VHLRDAPDEWPGYSRFRAGTYPTQNERGEKKMFYGDYYHALAKERMHTAIREREHDHLVKQLRSASKGTRSGVIARSAALIMSLFR
jgi:hypothetical protein